MTLKTRCKYMVGYHKRSELATARAKMQITQWITTGEVGKLKYIRVSIPPGDYIAGGFQGVIHCPFNGISSSEADPEQEGYTGMNNPFDHFVNYYIHQINLLRWLAGESYGVSYADPSGVLMVGHTASGIPLSLEMSTHRTSIDWQEKAMIVFERGWIEVEYPAPLASFRPGKVTLFSEANPHEPITIQPQLPWEHAMLTQAKNFIKVIRGEIVPPCGPEEAVEDLQVALDYIKLKNKG